MSGLREARVGESADADLAVEQRAGGRVLQRELALQAGLGLRPVDVGHDRRGQHDAADGGGGGDLRVQLQRGGDAEMGAELARKHLDGVAGLGDAERRAAVAQHLLDLEAAVVEGRHVALRGLEHVDVGGEAALGQQRRLQAQRRGVAAVGRLGHGAGIGEQAAGPGGGDADGVGELAGVEPEQVPGRHRGAERTGGAGRMEADLARLELARRLPDPALHLHALDERGQHLAAARPARLRQRQHAGERGGQRMVGRAPHRLEVEHVHGRAVERRRRHRVEAEAVADRGGLRRRRPAP